MERIRALFHLLFGNRDTLEVTPHLTPRVTARPHPAAEAFGHFVTRELR
jgi:hypothetical protein